MKKLITVILAAAMLCTMSLTAFAATVTTGTGSDSADVKGTYQAGTPGSTVYRVDISWGAMEFTYTDGAAGVWDPETHAYGTAGSGSWSSTTNAVTVTNHSNAAVTATLSYAPEASYSAISGSFAETSGTANDGILTLATAEGTTAANPPSATATLNLTGALASGTTNTKIGTVTVTLS